jgi:hypothetical protein
MVRNNVTLPVPFPCLYVVSRRHALQRPSMAPSRNNQNHSNSTNIKTQKPDPKPTKSTTQTRSISCYHFSPPHWSIISGRQELIDWLLYSHTTIGPTSHPIPLGPRKKKELAAEQLITLQTRQSHDEGPELVKGPKSAVLAGCPTFTLYGYTWRLSRLQDSEACLGLACLVGRRLLGEPIWQQIIYPHCPADLRSGGKRRGARLNHLLAFASLVFFLLHMRSAPYRGGLLTHVCRIWKDKYGGPKKA